MAPTVQQSLRAQRWWRSLATTTAVTTVLVLAWTLPAAAQTPPKTARIGMLLYSNPEADPTVATLRQGLRGLGYRVHPPTDEHGPLHAFSVQPRFVREREEQRERQRQQERERRDQRRRERPNGREERPNERQFFSDAPRRDRGPGGPKPDRRDGPPQGDRPKSDRPRDDRPPATSCRAGTA